MVRGERPIWHLEGFCPICEQGESLVLCACPNCQHIGIICAEEGAGFIDAKVVAKETAVEPENIFCPVCAEVKLLDFENATSEQIRAAGFQVGKYA